MSVNFQCPACKRNLVFDGGDSSFSVCRYCNSKIIVPSSVVHEQEALEAKPTSFTLAEHRRQKLAEIQSELNAGRKIAAISLFQEAFNANLATAKKAVDLLEQGGRIPGEAISEVNLDSSTTPQVYTTHATQPAGTIKSAPAIFWVIVSIGIAIAWFFLGDS